ncbi:alpha/beta hydrolase [Sulfurimonas sp.]|nr:alpha/beta hydrolase [Sulfurimonas sp.]
MQDNLYDASHVVFAIVEKAMTNSITISGVENLDEALPTLFVANHFTRVETFLIPYVLYKKLGFKVRSLADYSIFKGMLGDYMSAVGTVSTKDEKRNEKILGDLITGRVNWVIYPEGAMIKNKKVVLEDNSCLVENSEGLHDIFTGSAVLALKSELEKTRYLNAQNACNVEEIREFREEYFFDKEDELSYHNTNIIPMNISYSPIRTGTNRLVELAQKYIDNTTKNIDEEIEIESNLLLNSQLHVHFSKPIDVKDYLLKKKREFRKKGLEYSEETVIQKVRIPLTNLMMSEVYKNTLITFDHIYALCLEYIGDREFTMIELKSRIYLLSRELKTLETYRLDGNINANLYKLLNDEPYDIFDNVFQLSKEQNILLHVEGDTYKVDVKNFKNEYTFHTIRLKNILRVLLNEVQILEELHVTAKKEILKSSEVVFREVMYIIYNRDKKQFKYDYNKYYSVLDSKHKDVGKPILLYDEKNSIGCVISHGYKSAPKEIELLAQYLFEHGINVYGVRLKGHGTMPEDLRDSKFEDWYDSFDVGYSAFSGVNEKLYLCGFSTGGLLSLLKASNIEDKISGVICLNSAISLQDIRVKYIVPTINVINNFLSIFNADVDTYESEPEHPEINYKMHYLVSVGELKKLIDLVNDRLKYITEPTLIIQADEDPTVDPNSADIIYDNIASNVKEKYMVQSDKHVITLDKNVNQDVFQKVLKFIQTN